MRVEHQPGPPASAEELARLRSTLGEKSGQFETLYSRHNGLLMYAAQDNAGIVLTESQAMLPTAAVSGFYFGHPDSQYFGVARIGRDQLEDYAGRRGVDLPTAERWLRPNLD